MIAAYSCFLSQAFPFLLLNVTLLFSFGAFVFEGKQHFVDFYQLLLVFIPGAEHFQREGGKYMNSYFLSTLSDSALHTLSWCR